MMDPMRPSEVRAGLSTSVMTSLSLRKALFSKKFSKYPSPSVNKYQKTVVNQSRIETTPIFFFGRACAAIVRTSARIGVNLSYLFYQSS